MSGELLTFTAAPSDIPVVILSADATEVQTKRLLETLDRQVRTGS